jgi:hypothetical protein
VLLACYDGRSYDQVLDLVTTPVKADGPVEPND